MRNRGTFCSTDEPKPKACHPVSRIPLLLQNSQQRGGGSLLCGRHIWLPRGTKNCLSAYEESISVRQMAEPQGTVGKLVKVLIHEALGSRDFTEKHLIGHQVTVLTILKLQRTQGTDTTRRRHPACGGRDLKSDLHIPHNPLAKRPDI